MAGSEIKHNLEEIIKARSQKAKEQKDKARSLEREWEENQEKLNQIYGKFSNLSEDERSKVCGGEAAAILESIPAKMAVCDGAVKRAVGELDNLAKRFSRSTVNLVIVGAMGAGKSKFLQSASGLGDDCIPSYFGSSCTGVTSIIENSQVNEEAEAVFIFKTRQEALEDMRKEIRSFARRLGAQAKISGEMADFTEGVNNLKDLQKLMESPDRKIVSADDGIERTIEEKDRSDLAALIALYDEHRPDWEPYLSGGNVPDRELEAQEENGVRTYVLKKQSEIEKYVSKHNADGSLRYYKYAAVKKAVIRTRFSNGIDAHIRLIDTVGIGDTAVDTEARIEDAVRNDADGVIFLLSAGTNRPDFLLRHDRALIEKFQDIYNSYSKKEVDAEGRPRKEKRTRYWMAFLINDRYIEGTQPDNGQSYLEQGIIPSFSGENKLFSKGEGLICKKALDVSVPGQVEQMLSEFLQQISDHLEEIDAGIETSARSALANAKAQEASLCDRLKDIHINRNRNSRLIYITDITINRIGRLKKKLGEQAEKILEDKASGNKEASFLQQCLAKVRCLKEGNSLTDFSFGGNPEVSLEGIVDYYEEYYNSGSVKENFPKTRLAVFDALQGLIREIGSRPLERQEQAEKDFKREIAEQFINNLELDCQKLGDSPAEALEAEDLHFFKKAAERLIDGLPYTDEIKKAFLSLDQFKLDDSNGITKALFCCLAAEHLMDTPYNMQEFPPNGKTDKERLLWELKQKLQEFMNAVNQRTMSENYMIDESDQKYYELVNFMQILSPVHEGRWQNIFASMDEQNLLRDDTERRNRLVAVAAIAEDLDTLLQTF